MVDNDVFNGYGVPIKLPDDECFLKVKETLTRCGVSSYNDKTLYQSCHILHKRGEYAILHFKELFEMDGKSSSITESDIGRRNTIAKLLQEWDLLKIIDEEKVKEPSLPVSKIKILTFREKSDWKLVPKYTVGRSKPHEYYETSEEPQRYDPEPRTSDNNI
jgi:hypothetical protein